MRRARAAACAAARTTAPARPRPGQPARNLGQTGRGRDIVLASRPRLEELVLRHPFWCRDLAEDRTEEVLGRDMKIHVTTWGEQFEVTTSI